MELVKVTQSCLTLCNSMDYTVHGILQARILQWVAFPFSRGSSQLRDWTQVSHIEGGFFTSCATREAIMGLVPCKKRKRQKHSPLLHPPLSLYACTKEKPGKRMRRQLSVNQEIAPHQRESAGTLILDFPGSRPCPIGLPVVPLWSKTGWESGILR